MMEWKACKLQYLSRQAVQKGIESILINEMRKHKSPNSFNFVQMFNAYPRLWEIEEDCKCVHQ